MDVDDKSGERVERVQALIQDGNGLQFIPKEYVQPPGLRPNLVNYKSSFAQVPVINLFNFQSNNLDKIRQDVGKACREWGVFQVINHEVPTRLLDDMRDIGLKFFETPVEHKLKYACKSGSPTSEGYGSKMLVKEDQVLDWRDYFNHHTQPISRRNPSCWPDDPPFYRETVQEYSEQIKLLAQRLLAVISESIGLKSTYIQDVLKEGEWITVQPLRDAIVVNLGDQTQILTNGTYKSAEHRAIVNAHKARLSVATFYDPSRQTRIRPAPELVSKDSLPRYREVLYGDYVNAWYTKGPEGKRNIDELSIKDEHAFTL
ncbi:jasmonate-induced oxygenase 2 isoform X2 [Cryptomeria japonica]|uniref:jasmonate-induced oxygenase 2 isoform X2 n=1 Tax=Cryptomeria japonica TaxID=3369 RepID=UPI0025ACFA25|nr:jasmonate-induced oxygenase 2 isoform X2 [Cryptomeria japonica]